MERRLTSNILEELEQIVDPYSKRCPSTSDDREHMYGFLGKKFDRNDRIFHDMDFDVEESQEEVYGTFHHTTAAWFHMKLKSTRPETLIIVLAKLNDGFDCSTPGLWSSAGRMMKLMAVYATQTIPIIRNTHGQNDNYPKISSRISPPGTDTREQRKIQVLLSLETSTRDGKCIRHHKGRPDSLDASSY